ncbi:MAG: nitroreductase family protein [Rhodocyclaceae bacterium]|nr:nitroreductase family protein [Rhodocyclaceae bacterium]MCA4902557.1 nitroreductase family protein [Rhodocyclaceae bacterium]
MTDPEHELARLLADRFQDAGDLDTGFANEGHVRMASHASMRDWADRPLPEGMLRTLAAIALSSPSKSDMQSRDIVVVTDPQRKAGLAALTAPDAWIAAAPALLVFCGNHRRQRQIGEWRGVPFANDHLDWFFNAAVDASLVLGSFIVAAEAAGLGCCPISQIRNRAEAVSTFLGLPERVFPVAGLAVGWPGAVAQVSPRLPLKLTVHADRYRDEGEAATRAAVDDYDRWRDGRQPYRRQRRVRDLGVAAFYGWSEDKARQYSVPERADFGAYIRARGFKLD